MWFCKCCQVLDLLLAGKHRGMDNVVRRGFVSLEEICQVVQYFLYSPQKKPPASPALDVDEPEEQPIFPIDIRLKILRDLLQQLSTPNTVFDKTSPSKALPPRVASSQFRNFILDKLEKLESIQHLLELFGMKMNKFGVNLIAMSLFLSVLFFSFFSYNFKLSEITSFFG